MRVTRRISWLDPERIRDCFDYEAEFEEDTPDSSERFLALLRLWGELHHLIVSFISYGSILPCSDAPTTARLSALLPTLLLVKSNWDCQPFVAVDLDNLVSYHEVMMVPETTVKVTPTFRKGWLDGGLALQWWSCQALVDKTVGRKSPCSAGMTEDDREDLLACSQCLAVRYCSTGHQKIRRIQHKKVCFKPLW